MEPTVPLSLVSEEHSSSPPPPSQGKAQEYLVSWKGFSESDNSWEPARNLDGASTLVEAFKRARKNNKVRSLAVWSPHSWRRCHAATLAGPFTTV